MQPEARERLRHILAAGEKIIEGTAEGSFDDYAQNQILKWAIERLFTIVGEALREALRVEPELANRITGYRRIVDFRNLLVHGYATVYDEAVWRIIEEHLPILLAEVRAILATPAEPA